MKSLKSLLEDVFQNPQVSQAETLELPSQNLVVSVMEKVASTTKRLEKEEYLRDADETQRLKLEELMHQVEKRNAPITVVSTEHEAGAKLLSLGGIAALLRFPIYRDTPINN